MTYFHLNYVLRTNDLYMPVPIFIETIFLCNEYFCSTYVYIIKSCYIDKNK